MKLLISNDDGIFAQGIRSLADALAAAGHHVSVVCPDGERSLRQRPHPAPTHPRRNYRIYF